MFDILSIWVDGFKSFKGRHEFEFPTDPGLYYATGKNLDNPRLGANGVGKSTFLIDAIHWCFYGKTPRGLRATDVIEWFEGTSCAVGISVLIDDEVFSIVRTQKPNSLKLNDRTVDQEELTNTLRLNPDAFTYSIVMPQFGQHFFDLRPGDKLALFSQIMDLEYWIEKSKMAATRSNTLADRAQSLANRISRLEGNLETARTQRNHLKESKDEFDNKQERKISSLKAERTKIKNEYEKLSSIESGDDSQSKKLQNRLEQLATEHDEKQSNLNETQRVITDFQYDIRDCKKSIGLTNQEIERFSRMKGKVCTTCKQRIDEKHIDKQKAIHKKTLTDLTSDLKEMEANLSGGLTMEQELKGDITNVVKKIRKLSNEKIVIDNKVSEHRTRLKSLEKDMSYLSATIREEKERKNPYTKMLKEAKDEIKGIKEEIPELEQDLATTLQKHEATSYWVKGFKRIRLFIIEEALKSLEIEVNNNLTNLGLLDWEIRFDVERENKSGGISQGFSVFIHTPRHDKPVRWEAFSGGETQRLRLAGDMGLANLILERVGLVSAFEVHDEPSEHLSPEGLADVVETLYDRAHSLDRKIWLVEQHSVDFGGFSGKLTVTKDENGSHLEYED